MLIAGALAAAFLAAACSTMVRFNVYDYDTGEPVEEYTVQIDGRTLSPGQTVELTTAAWEEFSVRVQAAGYKVIEYPLAKTIYGGRLIVGLLLFWPELGWCYGPKGQQTIYLVKNKTTE